MQTGIRLSRRMDAISYPIRDISMRARAIAASGKKMHWLNIGDPNKFGFKPPRAVTDAVIEALHDPAYSGYCPADGDPQLRAAIAKNEGIDPKDVFVTSGLCEGIRFAYTALLGPGDQILLPSPCYPMYTTAAKLVDADYAFYGCTGEDFLPDVDSLRRKITDKTRAVALISPNNPTGAVWPRKRVAEIAEVCAEHSLPLICDEIYDLLTFEEAYVPTYTFAKDTTIIRGNGISKNYFYPGARVGASARTTSTPARASDTFRSMGHTPRASGRR